MEDLTQIINKRWQGWKYKNTLLLIISLILFYYLVDTPAIQGTIKKIGGFGYLGAFITGTFFVSIFTVAPATVVLYDLADILNPLLISIASGIGAVLGDYLIFRFLKDKVFEEIGPLFDRFGGRLLKKLFHTPYFIWLIPFVGAAIIASPAPDEIGISMLGLSRVKNWHFVTITFLLNAVGIFFIITLARSL